MSLEERVNKIEERNSEKYTRIENLNPYEFTNCVAYELQMRKQNKESEIREYLEDIIPEYKDRILQARELIEKL